MNSQFKILIVRQDRLGDLLMTLPCLVYLRQVFPGAKIHLSCQSAFHELLSGFCSEYQVSFVKEFESGYDGVLFLMGSTTEGMKLLSQGIPVRVGLYSRPFSFMFLNYGIRQKRSSSGKNEAESNLELAELLARRLGVNQSVTRTRSALPVNENSKAKALTVLKNLGISESDPFVVFHPGMRGSALNLSAEAYLELMTEMENQGMKLVLSVGPERQDLEMKEALLKRRASLPVITGLSLSELAECFRMAKKVVAPSTGPLHLAHWVGVPTLGLYSPVKSQHPNRWAPWGGEVAAKVLLPQVDCPAKTDCFGAKCQYFDCMEKTDWRALFGEGG